MYYFISIMCAHNVPVSSSRYTCFALILEIHTNYVGKELTVQDTFKRSVYAAAFSLVLIGHVRTHG